MKLTYSVFLVLFAAVGFYYAQAASMARDTDTSSDSSDEEHTTAGNYSEVQKQDDDWQGTPHGMSDLETGVEEHTTVKGERAEQVTATMNVTTTTSKESDESDVDPNIQGDIELLCNKSPETKDHDTVRQKRQDTEDTEDYHYDDTELGYTE